MSIHRLNHAVLDVRDVVHSKDFSRRTLEFDVVSEFPGAAFLRAAASDNDHDLGIFGSNTRSGLSVSRPATV